MRLARGTADIAYAIASGHTVGSVRLDNLRFGSATVTTTGDRGQYSFPSLPAGNYRIQVTSPTGTPFTPANGRQSASVVANTATTDIDFGFVLNTSQWQNPTNRHDVNNDKVVSPLDALIIINDLNARRSRVLTGTNFIPPPFIDVSGDSSVSPLDVLLVINYLNSLRGGGGEGEGLMSPPPSSGLSSGSGESGSSSAMPPGDGEFTGACQAAQSSDGAFQWTIGNSLAAPPFIDEEDRLPSSGLDEEENWNHELVLDELVGQLASSRHSR